MFMFRKLLFSLGLPDATTAAMTNHPLCNPCLPDSSQHSAIALNRIVQNRICTHPNIKLTFRPSAKYTKESKIYINYCAHSVRDHLCRTSAFYKAEQNTKGYLNAVNSR